MTSSPTTTNSGPRGVELLAIDGVELWEATPASAAQEAPKLTTRLAAGKLTTLLVSIDVNDPSHTASGNPDVWLVLNVRNASTGSDRPFPILAAQRVLAHRPTHSYRFVNPPHQGGSGSSVDVVLKLPQPASELGADEKTPFDLDPAEEAYFEDILGQYCAFEEPQSPPPPPFSASATSSGAPAPVLPPRAGQGEIELFDESGKLIGHLEGSFDEDPSLHRDALASSRNGLDAKNPVLIDLSATGKGGQPRVTPLREGDEEAAKNSAGAKEEVDWLVRSAQVIGRGLVKGSIYLGSKMNSAADAYIERNPSKYGGASASSAAVLDNEKGTANFTSSPTDTHFPRSSGSSTPTGASSSRYATTQTGQTSRSHYLHKYTSHAVSISHTTTSAILSVASNVGDRVGKATGIQRAAKPDGTLGPAPKGVRGVLNRGIIAASSLLDSLEQAGENLLSDSGNAASRVIGHKYGPDAERRTGNVTLAGRNIYAVYKDVMGVRRRVLIRTVVGSSLKARTPEGEVVEVRLGTNDAAAVAAAAEKR
ncbi:hypothetical protein OC842_004645 [Tilletia horrida]|uniref:Senescence domain-containing protein n=1 Tax=Tilletia horrida TaxID=155126 RepID=A0AAN6G987_9BASI|nr:hypothetical protein OC842_004645 [Tilletia horrida]